MTLHMPQQHTLQAADAMHAPAMPTYQEQRQLQQGLTQQQQARPKVERQAATAVQPAMAEGVMQDGAQLAEQAATNGQIQGLAGWHEGAAAGTEPELPAALLILWLPARTNPNLAFSCQSCLAQPLLQMNFTQK